MTNRFLTEAVCAAWVVCTHLSCQYMHVKETVQFCDGSFVTSLQESGQVNM